MELETEDGKLGEVVDDVLSKMARGESVDVEQYAAEHPDVADVKWQVLATKDASAPRARLTGLNGLSIDPIGLVLVVFPISEVGEY